MTDNFEGIKTIWSDIRLAREITGLVFLSVNGPYSADGKMSRKILGMLKIDRFAKNIRAMEMLGKFDLVFGFDVPRFTNYDYILSLFLGTERVKGIFTVPCVKVNFDNEETGQNEEKTDSTVFLFMRTDDKLSAKTRYSNVFTIAKMLQKTLKNQKPTPPTDKPDDPIDPCKGIKKIEVYLTYSLYDLLLILTVENPSYIPGIVTTIQNHIQHEVRETVTLIGTPKQSMSHDKSFEVEIFIRVSVGLGQSIQNKIAKILKKNKLNHMFTWRHGYYDMSCRIMANDLKNVSDIISRKIRKIPGLKTTATTFSGILQTDASASFGSHVVPSVIADECGSDFVKLRSRIWKRIETRKRDPDLVTRLMAEKQNTLFNHLEQILYRLRYVRFRWNSYKDYLSQSTVFDQIELVLGESLILLEKSETWDELQEIEYSIEALSRFICNVERAFAQKLESLDIADAIGIHPRGTEKLGGIERILEAMEYVAKDYYSSTGRSWSGIVVCGVQKEEFEAEGDVDIVSAPSFSKYRIKAWPLIAHEIGHQIVPPDRYILEDKTWSEILDDLRSLVDRFPSVFNIGTQTSPMERQRILREIIAEIYANFVAGTSYAKSLVGHYYVPQYFFDVQTQRIVWGLTRIPISLRLELAKETLANVAPDLANLIESEEKLSSEAYKREHKAVISHLKLWNRLGKVSNQLNEELSKPYGDEIRQILKTVTMALKQRLEEALGEAEIVETLTAALNNVEHFCEIRGMYSEHVRDEALKLYQQEIAEADIKRFMRAFTEASRTGLSLFQRILKMFGVSPFARQIFPDYDAITAEIRKNLQKDIVFMCSPKYILEVIATDKTGTLNTNAAILSILLSGQARWNTMSVDTARKLGTSHRPT
jgi:hypothetical protein